MNEISKIARFDCVLITSTLNLDLARKCTIYLLCNCCEYTKLCSFHEFRKEHAAR